VLCELLLDVSGYVRLLLSEWSPESLYSQ
jgi:hypothetical protein